MIAGVKLEKEVGELMLVTVRKDVVGQMLHVAIVRGRGRKVRWLRSMMLVWHIDIRRSDGRVTERD